MTRAELYARLVRPALFSLDAETAHHFAMGALQMLSLTPVKTALGKNSWMLAKPTELFGLTFPNPIGLAAGFDKNGVALPAWEMLGFGFMEIGTVTARPQPGNPKPRIFRYPQQHAIINRLGFNNDGADVVAARLERLRAKGRWPAVPIGINVGKSKITAVENAADDYVYSVGQLREFADYLVLNVSSPNTLGLRSLQENVALTALLSAVQKANRAPAKPLLVKIAPDLTSSDLTQILRTCEGHDVAGLIATNTTLDHSTISAGDEAGGLSGPPVGAKSDEIIRAIVAQSRLPVIGVGGIMNAADAQSKFAAGAKLIQLYTGLVYRGPGLLREIAGAIKS